MVDNQLCTSMDIFSQYFVTQVSDQSLLTLHEQPFYYVVLLKGDYSIAVDFTRQHISGYSIIFISPYQHLTIEVLESNTPIELLHFHGDFYCIEYHKKEVACNGLLFNNIFIQPFLSLDEVLYQKLKSIYQVTSDLFLQQDSLNDPIIKTYLQLLLAYCSKEKVKWLAQVQPQFLNITTDLNFEQVLEQNFLQHKEVRFYAEYFNQPTDTFSKQIKKKYGKTPSKLIAERVVLEAKKQLHLTTLSIKEIAHNLNFNDEFYFSRFFKQAIGISPKAFRDKVGISIAAK